MKSSSDIFELAIMNTLKKVRNIPKAGNGITIGPQAPSNDGELYHELTDCTQALETLSNIQIGNRKIDDFATDDQEVDSSSNASKALLQLEYLRKIDVNDAVNERAQKITAVEEKLSNIMNEDLKSTREEINIRNKLKWKIAESSINDGDFVATRKFSELRKRHQETKPKLENEKNSQLEIEEKKKGEQIATVYRIYDDYCNICVRATEAIKDCKNPSKLLTEMTSDLLNIRDSRADFFAILEKVKKSHIEENDIEACHQIIQRVILLLNTIRNKMNFINEEADWEKKIEQVDQIEKAEQTISEEMRDTSVERREVDSSSAEKESVFGRYICKESLVQYIKLDQNLREIINRSDAFMKNPVTKTLARQLRMVAGTSVNTLSAVNAHHMRDKFQKISQLLLGNLSFSKLNISNVSNDEYYPFLLDNLSRKFINHIESLAPVKTSDAFAHASIIVALWIRFPNFGPVLLAHFAKKCPYVIPAYWPQYEGQSERDFYISRGYQCKQDGSIEDQNKFLLRMAAIFMLYVAIIVTVPRGNQPHPHGLCNAWKWLASILNLDPRPDITAALLHIFLELAGWKMSQYYGIQFWKMMHLINTEYFNKIEKVTTADFRGPVSRLKGYIEKLLRDGRFSEPKGILPPNYW